METDKLKLELKLSSKSLDILRSARLNQLLENNFILDFSNSSREVSNSSKIVEN